MHLLKVSPPVSGIILDCDLERGRNPFHLQFPDLKTCVTLKDFFRSKPFSVTFSASPPFLFYYESKILKMMN